MSNGPDEPFSPEEFERQKQERLKNLADPAERKRKEAEAIAKLGLNTLPKATSQELRDRDNAILADKGPRPLLDISEGKKPVPLPKSSLAAARDRVVDSPLPAIAARTQSPTEVLAALTTNSRHANGLEQFRNDFIGRGLDADAIRNNATVYVPGRGHVSPSQMRELSESKQAWVDSPAATPHKSFAFDHVHALQKAGYSVEDAIADVRGEWKPSPPRSVADATDKAVSSTPKAAPVPSPVVQPQPAPIQPATTPLVPQQVLPQSPAVELPRPVQQPAAQPAPSPPRTVTGARDAATPPTPAANVPPPPTPPRPPTAPAPGSPDEPDRGNKQPWWKRAVSTARSVSNSMFGSPTQPEGTASEQPKGSSPAWKAAKQVAGGIGMVAAVAALGGVAGIAGIGSVFGFGGEPPRSQDNADDDNKTILDRNGNWVGGPEPAPKEPETKPKQRTKQPQQRNWGQWLSQSIGLSTPSGEQQAAGQRRPRQKSPPRSPRSSDPRHAWMNDLLDGAEDQQQPQFTRTPPPPPTLAGGANAAMNWMVRNSGGIQHGIGQATQHAQNVAGNVGGGYGQVAQGLTGIFGNMTGAATNIGAGIASKDPGMIAKGVVEMGVEIATLPSKLKKFGDTLLEVQRPLAQYSGQMAAAYMRLDADRLSRDMRRAQMTASSTEYLARAQSNREEQMLGPRAYLENIMNYAIGAVNENMVSALKSQLPGVVQVFMETELYKGLLAWLKIDSGKVEENPHFSEFADNLRRFGGTGRYKEPIKKKDK